MLFESLFDKFECLQIPEDSIGFSVNTAKFLKTPNLKNIANGCF